MDIIQQLEMLASMSGKAICPDCGNTLLVGSHRGDRDIPDLFCMECSFRCLIILIETSSDKIPCRCYQNWEHEKWKKEDLDKVDLEKNDSEMGRLSKKYPWFTVGKKEKSKEYKI